MSNLVQIVINTPWININMTIDQKRVRERLNMREFNPGSTLKAWNRLFHGSLKKYIFYFYLYMKRFLPKTTYFQ